MRTIESVSFKSPAEINSLKYFLRVAYGAAPQGPVAIPNPSNSSTAEWHSSSSIISEYVRPSFKIGNANSEIVGQFSPSMIVGVVCISSHIEGSPKLRDFIQQRESDGSPLITVVLEFFLNPAL